MPVGGLYVSSQTDISGWQKENLTDGNPQTCWSSALHKDSNHEEWAAIDLGLVTAIDCMSVHFRSTQTSNVSNVPEYFVLQYTTANDEQWTDIPLHRYTHVYPVGTRNIPYPESKTENEFSFEPVYAQKVRIKAEKLRDDNAGNFCLQIGEIRVHESKKDIQRFYTSLGSRFDADLNNFYNIKTLAQNQKDYKVGYVGFLIGSVCTYGCAVSGLGCAWYASIVWDDNSQKRKLLDNAHQLPVTKAYKKDGQWVVPPTEMPALGEAGIVWSTNAYVGHLGNDDKWLCGANAQYIMSIWEYLKWAGDKKSLTSVPDRMLKVQDIDGQWKTSSDRDDYIHRIGVFHTIGQGFTTSTPIKAIGIGVYASRRSNFELAVLSKGREIARERFQGIDDRSLGTAWDNKGWVEVANKDGVWPAGDYCVVLRNLGQDPDRSKKNPKKHNFFISPVGWLTSYRNVFGADSPASHQVATINGSVQLPLLENARVAMNYQLRQMHGEKGILTIDGDSFQGELHQGNRDDSKPHVGNNRPCSYWDVPRFGYKNTWHNTLYYGSLWAMSNIEEMIGDQAKADYYRKVIMPTVNKDFTKHFWNPQTGRFISNIGTQGERLDFGHTINNLMAVYYGLADADQTRSIMTWVNGDRLIPSDTSTGIDIYHFGYAPRTNTLELKSTGRPYFWNRGYPLADDPEDWGWSVKPDGTGLADFGWEQNGGARLFYSYYDLKNRVQYLGSDNAWDRFKTILNQYHQGGFYREAWRGGKPYQPGLISAPEDGIVPLAFIEGFLGIEAESDGLHIKPNLPRELGFAGMKEFVHWGSIYSIRVDRSVGSPQVKSVGLGRYHMTIPANADIVVAHGQIVQR